MYRLPLTLLLCAVLVEIGCAQSGPPEYDSGGPLMPEQAAYDVTYYALDLAVSPADSTINGTLAVQARVLHPTDVLVLDLDPRLDISAVTDLTGADTLAFTRQGGKVWIALGTTQQPGSQLAARVAYGGRPRVAPNPPWDGGFTWAQTADGSPWIATSCQTIGADVWWPTKDHPSDEPDSMAISITVPEPLVVASNGRLRGVTPLPDGRRRYNWFVSTPINVYNVALNIAPYVTIEDTMQSVAGDAFPVQFFVLPEDEAQGRAFFPEILEHLAFYERLVGPYPFRADKYGVAMTPHLGMEHQSIIAYGARFNNAAMTAKDYGFDALHHHELAHEWWGNLVTNSDWRDMWIHEGFGSYMQALYIEEKFGAEPYRAFMQDTRGGINNREPVAARTSRSSQQIYGGDIYVKGSWILHTLRYVMGDAAFFTFLRRMAYPDPALEAVTDGGQTRFASTEDVRHLAESISGRSLAWFFEVYLRQPKLPRLMSVRDGDTLTLSWDVPDGLPFPMPVEVQIGAERHRIDLSAGSAQVTVPEDVTPLIDPDHRILKIDP